MGVCVQFDFSNGLITEMRVNSAIRDRRIYINGVIDEELSFETCYFLNRIKDIDDKENIPIDKREKITLVINSYGGSVICGNAIIGTIEHFKTIGYQIEAIVQGFAYSMAFGILVCCSKRYGYLLSDYMVHQIQIGMYQDNMKEMEMTIEGTKKQWNKMVQYITKYTNITEEQLQEIYDKKTDWFMDCDEALSLGVVDEII